MIRQLPLPQRKLECRLLHIVRIKADRDEDHLGASRGALAVEQNLIVEGIIERDAEVRLQCRMCPSEPIELGDLAYDVARCVLIANTDFVLLGVEIFLAAGERRALAELESRVDAPQA